MSAAELKSCFDAALKISPVIAILRGITADETVGVCRVLAENGIKLLEIPLNTPNALDRIAQAVECAQADQLVGAGTVLTAEDVRNVKAAGGKFIIAPNTDCSVIKETKKLGLISIPGCFTATEAFTAQSAGADYLKLFPAGAVGASYIKDLKAVVSLPFLAVGGVSSGNVKEYLQCSAGVGVGSAFYKPGRSLEDIERGVKEFMQSLR